MKIFMLLLILIITFLQLLPSCSKQICCSTVELNLDIEYLKANGKPLFDDSEIKPDPSDISMFYLINGSLIKQPEGILYYEENNKKIIQFYLNHTMVSDSSTTIVQLKGYPADTLIGHFINDDYGLHMKRVRVNNKVYKYGDIVILTK